MSIEPSLHRVSKASGEAPWSACHELDDLEVVWDSLCQEAATPKLQLPVLPPSRQVRAAVRRVRPAEGREAVRWVKNPVNRPSVEGPSRLAS